MNEGIPEQRLNESIRATPAVDTVHPASAPRPAQRKMVVHIRPTRGLRLPSLRDLVEYRELLYFLAQRDVKVRYKQAVFGAAWAVLQPLLMMLIFWIFLGRLARVPSEGIPYPLFAFGGLVPWFFFANALGSAGRGLLTDEKLVTRVYFPRILIPISATLAWLPDVGISVLVLFGFMAAYSIAPPPTVVTLPLFLLLALVAALGVGTFLSALNARYRDVNHALPFLVQLWLFATPVAYPASMVPERFRFLVGINPMAGVVEGFRWALFGVGSPPGALLAVSVLVALASLFLGTVYFTRMERTFADVI